jgi:hypothetical protein
MSATTPVGNWGDKYEPDGTHLARVVDAYLADISPGFELPYERITDWHSREALRLIGLCRLLVRRGRLRAEMQEAAKLYEPVGYAVQSVAGRFFDAMTMDERREVRGLHFDLDESKWRVNVTLLKEEASATPDSADATAAEARSGPLPDGPSAESGPAGPELPGADDAAQSHRGAGEAPEAPLLPAPAAG